MPWYLFCPTGIIPPYDVCDPNNYIIVGTTPPTCPNPNNFLCAIQAMDNQGRPIITCALRCEIANAVNNRIDTTNVMLRPKVGC